MRLSINFPKQLGSGLYKCRILYNEKIVDIQFEQYNAKHISTLQCVESSIDYTYKWVNRKALDELYKLRKNSDDILIIKDGLVSDSYYANVAFLKSNKWYSPKQVLLRGTQRERLIKKGEISINDIQYGEIYDYEKIAIFNSMRAFGEIILPIDAVKPLKSADF